MCPRCREPIESARMPSGSQQCARCGGSFEATRFEPPAPTSSVRTLERAGPQGSAACAAHPGNAAVGHCSRCGVFMCDLCRIETDGQALCPGCFDRLSAEGALPSARLTFRDYGRMGTTLLLLGILLWPFAVLFGLGASYAGIQGLRQRKRLGEGSAGRGWLSVGGGLLELAGGAALWVSMVRALTSAS